MKISSVLTRLVICAESTESLAQAASRMTDSRIGALAVTEQGRFVGLVSERDVVRAAAEGRDLLTTPIYVYMTTDLVSADPDDDSEDVAIRMLEYGVRHLPVVRLGELLGMVSMRDLLVFEALTPAKRPALARS